MHFKEFPVWAKGRQAKTPVVFGNFPKHINKAIKAMLRPGGSPKAVRYWLHQYRLKKNKTKGDKRVILALELLEPDARVVPEHVYEVNVYKQSTPRFYILNRFYQAIGGIRQMMLKARRMHFRVHKARSIADKEITKLKKYRELNAAVPGVVNMAGEKITWSAAEIKESERQCYTVLETPEGLKSLLSKANFQRYSQNQEDRRVQMAADLVYGLCEYTSLASFGEKMKRVFRTWLEFLKQPSFDNCRDLLVFTPFEYYNDGLFASKHRPKPLPEDAPIWKEPTPEDLKDLEKWGYVPPGS